MTVRGLFVSGDGRLRAGWRVGIFLGLFLGITVGLSLVLTAPFAMVERWTGIEGTGGELTVTIAALAAHALMLRFIDRRSWSYVRMDATAVRPRLIGSGAALGAFPVTATSLALIAIGWLSFKSAPAGSWMLAAAKISVLLIPAALVEELVARGYVMAALADGVTMPGAVAITSVAFGVVHIGNPGATPQPILMVTIAGIFLAVVQLATRSLYAAWAAHFVWNWTMAAPLHIAVSGNPFPRPGYELVDSGPDWATGGDWGPEGGLLAGAAMIVGMAWMYVRHRNAQRTTQT